MPIFKKIEKCFNCKMDTLYFSEDNEIVCLCKIRTPKIKPNTNDAHIWVKITNPLLGRR